MENTNYEINTMDYQGMIQAVFLATQDAISVVNERGVHILVNPAYTKITGLEYDDVIGKDALYDIEEGESLHMKVLTSKKPVQNTKLKIRPSGKTVVAQAAPIIVNGVMKGSVAVLHDMSGIKDLTDKLEEAEKKLRELTYKYKPEDIIGDSAVIREVKIMIEKAAKVPATVLLRGESGTGKELFANSIHAQSSRNYNKFIRVNCAALSDSLLESELFGYEEGSFTGALKGGRKGLFEEANKGTIFLDEISEISMNTQAKLLRVLQEKEIMRVGSNKTIAVDVRVIAATNADLIKSVEEGKFREDLFYRLSILPIFIPPLRERKEDIPILVKNFIVKFNDDYGRNIVDISNKALRILVNHEWPGNVRELENVVGRSIINMNINEKVIQTEHLPHLYSNKKVHINNGAMLKNENIINLSEIIEKAESEYISNVYITLNRNKTKTAKVLGISIRSLYYKMEKYGIE
ncbi:MAG: sigma 54-interacting transcriptional regulator [Sedimentibacter sp.]|uniref:sigma-54 interaction domain-containing protein n=1 Tax=Sedimentibacter sp. TaxID=1960295 RepID=UPI002982B6FF|nr:sigma 54-interacting transcriptional regulator [Sedimentibacter sp.]MDW5298597.1 sigma 54-interacting transcriptional regulator [Sedimentibacter sp.]